MSFLSKAVLEKIFLFGKRDLNIRKKHKKRKALQKF